MKFDVHYHDGGISIDAHFCREWTADGGCYGTNPDHGFTFDEACDQVAEYYERLAKGWRDRSHPGAAYWANAVPQTAADGEGG